MCPHAMPLSRWLVERTTVFLLNHGRNAFAPCEGIMSACGTFETCRLTLRVSVNGGRPEVIRRRSNRRE